MAEDKSNSWALVAAKHKDDPLRNLGQLLKYRNDPTELKTRRFYHYTSNWCLGKILTKDQINETPAKDDWPLGTYLTTMDYRYHTKTSIAKNNWGLNHYRSKIKKNKMQAVISLELPISTSNDCEENRMNHLSDEIYIWPKQPLLLKNLRKQYKLNYQYSKYITFSCLD